MLDSWPESILDSLKKLLIVVRNSGLALILTKKIKIRARINFSCAVVRTINLTLASSGHQQGPVVVTIRLKGVWEFLGLHLRVWEAKKKKKYTKVSWTEKKEKIHKGGTSSVFKEGKKRSMAKAERSSQNMRCRKKTFDIPDIPKLLLDIPYGILTPYVSEVKHEKIRKKIVK